MVGHFTLPVSSWFADYYDPMQERINELRGRYKDNATALRVVDSAQLDVSGFKKYSREVGYEFFVARKE